MIARLAMKAYSEVKSDVEASREEIEISNVEESPYSTLYTFGLATSSQDTNRIEVTCLFDAEEAYFLTHDRRIQPLISHASPPFPVGCIFWIKVGNCLFQIDLPKYPHLRLSKQSNHITARFVIRDRFGAGLILWGDHKIRRSAFHKTFHIRANRLRSLKECVWLEPYPSGVRSVICLTDHPDFDSVPKLRLLYELFSKNEFRITKGVFPKSDPKPGFLEPGLDLPEYKSYIDMLYESGSEIAYHGLSPRIDPPPFPECMRRIELMSMYSPRTWIDHGCGTYLFSKDAAFKEGPDLVHVMSKAGIKNYWSYTDVWENPTRHLNVWKRRRLTCAVSNLCSFLLAKRPVNAPLTFYYASSVMKNLLGPFHLQSIIKEPWKKDGWKHVAAHSRKLKYYHENPMVLYDLDGQSSLMSDQDIWVFDTVLLNHLAFQLRPSNVDLLCKQNGLLLAHCYFGHQKNKYTTINCFLNDSSNLSLIPEFVEAVRYIAEMQRQKELITLPFDALRTALITFGNSTLIRTSRGWEVSGIKAIAACRESVSTQEPTKQWCKGDLFYTEIEGQSLLHVQC
jgi:hypothetical protein